MDRYAIDEVAYFDHLTSSVMDGSAADADAAPTFSVFENATDTPILAAIAMTKRTSLTGHYRGTFTCSAGNGFEAEKRYMVVVTQITSGITAKRLAFFFKCTAVTEVSSTDAIMARLGAPVGASTAADIAGVMNRIGVAGAALTSLPWNTQWDAEVQSEVADALAVYDPPTNTEMEARTILAASYSTAANLALVKAVTDQFVFGQTGAVNVRITWVLNEQLQLNGTGTENIGGS